MRIIHTADWHVGAKLRGRSRADEFRAVLGELVRIIQEDPVDLVVVAGDLFDSASPGPEAEDIVYSTLLEIADTGAETVVVSGNHDHAARLRAVAALFRRAAGVHIGTRLDPDGGGIVRFETRSKSPVNVGLFPFLSQRQMARASDLMNTDLDHQLQTYSDRCHALIESLAAQMPETETNLLVGHLMVLGAAPGGGERTAHSTIEYSVPASALDHPPLDYVALGHLHRQQQLSSRTPAFYSGSLLQLDFSDKEFPKAVLRVDLEPGDSVRVKSIPVPGARRLRTVRGSVADLRKRCGELSECYLRVTLENASASAAAELRELFPSIVDIRIPTPNTGTSSHRELSLQGAAPEKLFEEFLDDCGEADPRLLKLFGELMEELYAPVPS